MKKAFLILLSHLLVFSIYAKPYAEPNSVQDSLIKRFLRFVPDSIALESVLETRYKDHEVEESWLLITKDVGAQDYEEAEDEDIFWNTENEYCRDWGSRGFVVLFKYKSGEYYKVVEDYHCLDSGEEDGEVYYYPPELDIYLNEDGILDISYSHGRYSNWGCSFKYIDGEFKYISSSSNESMSGIEDSTSHIDFYEGIEEKSNIINSDDVDDDNFHQRYIYHTYDATPTYLLSISEVVHEEGRVRDPDIEYVNYRLLKTEIDDYKIVDGEKQWYRREITEEEENEIEIQ